MPLQPGTTIGSYSVTAKIGEGGMGEVYQARDTKLDRDVALKVLPEAFTSDPDRLARFEREAKVLASLNHPNIGSIYGLEEAEGVRALVLELVEGPTLADRIKQGPIPVDEALAIAKQIAEALEAAHEAGVIHRDLKPANIKVKTDGTVKVLDFGLAKAFQPDASDPQMSVSPTISLTAAATQHGMILGTAAYMSPEQAQGQEVDKRSDIWAFGCVLYEMLTGRAVFAGDNVSLTLARILERHPDFAALPPNLHPRVRELLERCLEKEARNRWHDVADVRVDILKVLADPDGLVAQPASERDRSFRRQAMALIGVAVVVAALVGGAVWILRSPIDTAPVAALTIALPDDQQLAGLESMSPVAVAPNGDIAYVARRSGSQQLFLRPLNSLEARPVRGTEGAEGLFFSPDGQSLGFFGGAELKTVSIDGGVPTVLARASWDSRGGSWGSDGHIIFSRDGGARGLERIADSGLGEPESLTIPAEAELPHRFPQVLPGNEAIIFTIGTGGSWDDALIVAERLDTHERTILIEGGSDARYVPTGHLVYVRAGTLMAAPFDLDRLEAGDPVAVVEGVMQPTDITGAAFVGLSELGGLIYVPGTFHATDRTLVWMDRQGGLGEPLPLPSRPYNRLSLSPDGQQVAVEIDQGNQQQISIHDVSRAGSLTLLPLGGTDNMAPAFTSDGSKISFVSSRGTNTSLLLTGISDLLAPDGTFIHPRAAERTKFCSAHNRAAPEAVI